MQFTHRNTSISYFDFAATSPVPDEVAAAMSEALAERAPVHRGLYPSSIAASTRYELVRSQVAQFLGSPEQEIVFTTGSTQALNNLAQAIGSTVREGDEIIVTQAEHHSNLLPWQRVCQQTRAILRVVPITDGRPDYAALEGMVSNRTKVVSLAHISNVLGYVLDTQRVRTILTQQESTALFILDAAQSVAHLPLNVSDLGVDALVFSAHKAYGPSGIGVLWGKSTLLQNLPPFALGGDMVVQVSISEATFQNPPHRFEAGTPNLEAVVGLGKALELLQSTYYRDAQKNLLSLHQDLKQNLQSIPGLTILGHPRPESGLVSLTVKGVHPHDLADLLGRQNICVRAGHHCAQPLHHSLQLEASLRFSLGVTNTPQEITAACSLLQSIVEAITHV
jgi:cysteine desulfurase / selenocysteine lyase